MRLSLRLMLLILPVTVGCATAPPTTAPTPADARSKFDEIEQMHHSHSATLTAAAVEQLLGPGESVPPTHPDIAGGPPLIALGVQRWSRWESDHEVLLVGYAGDAASSVVKFRR